MRWYSVTGCSIKVKTSIIIIIIIIIILLYLKHHPQNLVVYAHRN